MTAAWEQRRRLSFRGSRFPVCSDEMKAEENPISGDCIFLWCRAILPLRRQSHPVGRVDGGQSIQIRHGELQTASPQVVVYAHHPRQGGRVTERIGPRLRGRRGEKKNDENKGFIIRCHSQRSLLPPIYLTLSALRVCDYTQLALTASHRRAGRSFIHKEP